ncbi:MAG: hypothetical protein JSS91_06030 [Bacteroidetes bacterium]|nr:hypothetical protein [Bacteroidota bacterium]
MPKIIFEINYNIYPEKRDEYLKAIKEIKKNINGSDNNRYSVFESKKLPNNFTEIFHCDSEEELDSIDDNQSDETKELIQSLFEHYIKDSKVVYSTKYEV